MARCKPAPSQARVSAPCRPEWRPRTQKPPPRRKDSNRDSTNAQSGSSSVHAPCASDGPGMGECSRAAGNTVLRNGKIVTMDRTKPSAEALAIRGDTILAVGSNQELQQHIGKSTQVIDLAGKLAIPGFIEGHGHLTGLGSARMSLNLMTVKNWDQVVSMVAESVTRAQPGDWILGRGWHQEKWDKKPAPNVEGFPTQESISKVSPNNPVLSLTPAATPPSPMRVPWRSPASTKTLPIRQGARSSGTRRAGPREFCARRRRGWSAKPWPRRAAGALPSRFKPRRARKSSWQSRSALRKASRVSRTQALPLPRSTCSRSWLRKASSA